MSGYIFDANLALISEAFHSPIKGYANVVGVFSGKVRFRNEAAYREFSQSRTTRDLT